MEDGHVVIVGAGLGGLRAAERLRAEGYGGSLTVIGAEAHLPYSRPPLSKELLAQAGDLTLAQAHELVAFRHRGSIADVEFRLGSPAVAADLAQGRLRLADDALVAFDGLVIASGLRPRRLPIRRAPTVTGSHVLRDLDDSITLRAALRPGARVAIIGGGFIGCEVAGTARQLGCEVTVVEALGTPMGLILGEELARAVQRSHEAGGIRFITGQAVTAVADAHGEGRPADAGAARSSAAALELASGELVPADVIVEAAGSLPNVEWLAGNGLDLSNGVLCDNTLAVVRAAPDAGTLERVVAVGDIARFPNPRYDLGPRRIEHWSMPTDTARRAAATLHAALSGTPADPAPFAPLPSFWSDQLELRMWSYGAPAWGTRMTVVEGDLENLAGGLIAAYYRDDRHVGTVTVNVPPKRLRAVRDALA
ncbi:MAG TPA: NAD(P)/FAD-dependent oxidoreductase [Trebonia sp.]|nr:NAD(P)/FAD-dependent oxidoreductase [Trebonia sp.]